MLALQPHPCQQAQQDVVQGVAATAAGAGHGLPCLSNLRSLLLHLLCMLQRMHLTPDVIG
jgi:hypothetical protein